MVVECTINQGVHSNFGAFRLTYRSFIGGWGA